MKAYPYQFRRIINLDERGECSFTVHTILEDGSDGTDILYVPPIPWDEMSDFDGSERFDPRNPACIRSWLIENGYAPMHECVVLRANEDPEFDIF